MDAIVLLCTVGSPEEGASIARELVDRRLAACVNLLPGVRSFYRWKGKTQDDGEHLLIIKSRKEKIGDLEAAIGELHSYAVPEILALDVAHGEPNYLTWIAESLQEPKEPS